MHIYIQMSLEEKAGCVEGIMQKLSLTKCADTIVGDSSLGARRGISGGEKKRLSIACELISEPKVRRPPVCVCVCVCVDYVCGLALRAN